MELKCVIYSKSGKVFLLDEKSMTKALERAKIANMPSVSSANVSLEDESDERNYEVYDVDSISKLYYLVQSMSEGIIIGEKDGTIVSMI